MSPTSKVARFVGTIFADIALAIVLLLLAMLMSILYLGPDSSPVMRSGLSVELWWILLAAIQAPLWTPAKSRRRSAAFLAGLLGVTFFFVVTTVGWRLFRSTAITIDTANQLDILARYGGIAIAIGISIRAMRPHFVGDRHVDVTKQGFPWWYIAYSVPAVILLFVGVMLWGALQESLESRRRDREYAAQWVVDSMRWQSILANPVRSDSVRRDCKQLAAASWPRPAPQTRTEALMEWSLDSLRCITWRRQGLNW